MNLSVLKATLAILILPNYNIKAQPQYENRSGPPNTAAPVIWLCGEDPEVQREKHKDQPADYMDLFGSTEGWPVAATRMLPETNPGSLTYEAKQLAMLFPAPAAPVSGLMQVQTQKGTLTSVVVQTVGANGPQIWFSPGDDLEVGGVITHPDFPKLFDDPSLWPTGLSHIDVVQFRAPYIARKPAESAKYYKFLKAHRISIAATMEVLPSENCGLNVEGIMSHKGIDFYPRVIKETAGIDLDYVVMDEPLYFGHEYSGKNACHLTIAEVAKGVAESVGTIRSYHPGVKFILAEPEQGLAGGPAELAEFLDDYKAVLHEYPASVRFDVQWRKDWRMALPPFIAMLEARKIGYGVIYNAPGGIKDDNAWITTAKTNAQDFAGAIRVKPDHIMIQTWDPNPSRIVPETDPNTMTGYLKWFVEHFVK